MRYNEDMLDAITILSFMIGIANYGENLSQNDKDDMMQALDRKTNDMIERNNSPFADIYLPMFKKELERREE